MKKYLLPLLAVLALSSLAGCAATLPARLPEGLQVKPVATADAGTPFDAAGNGTFVTVARGTVALTDGEGRSVKLLDGAATAIAFSPNGERLAVAVPEADSTLIRLLERSGKVLGQTMIPGKVTSIAWRSEKELLAGVLNVRKYSFGSQVTSRLFQWDGSSTPVATTLNDVTLRPQVAKLPADVLYNQLIITVSPYGDEIVFTSLKDPPLFAPYLKVVIKNLESGNGSEVGKAPLGQGKVLYAPDGESLVIGDVNDSARRISLPEGKELESWPGSAINPAISPSGSYVLLNGRLYQNGKEIATFPPDSRGSFLPDGSGLAISYRGQLYLVSGLKDGAAAPLPKDLERVLKLRRLRSQGLITDQEFRTQLRKEPSP